MIQGDQVLPRAGEAFGGDAPEPPIWHAKGV